MCRYLRRPGLLRRPLPFVVAVLLLVAVILLWLHPATGRAGRARGRSRPAPPCCPCPDAPAPQAQAPAGEGAEAAIRRVLDEQVAAWNRGDLDAFMTGYWASTDLSFFSAATRTQGWEATLQRYRKRYLSEGQEMGQLTFSELQIDLLGPDSALVRGRWQLVRRKDRPGGLFTLIFRRFPEGWRIVHDHTSSAP
jgi:beta-aspartyl-peptidase (threonine type)